ncbi:metallophosphoesterase [Pengzhenrongella sicca]|uniref:Metallophosphoesterase n=1 Tax=Pengzhenrongella sicca TaxID=2819238 RepID=A0A8A4ZGH3_9MICO|nr:metallophosphoesterase [Pengzhenrongella sicca]QTE30481.1 metallophosphoesterase [Pengzhenrongella sicca]
MSRRLSSLAVALGAAFAIGLAGLPSAASSTATPPAANDAVRAAAALAADGTVHVTTAGDYSTGANVRAVLSTVARLGPDLHVALGDLSYGVAGAEQSWCDLVTQHVGATFPFELLAGNHESNGVNGNIDAFAACLPNRLPGLVGTYGRQWYVDVPAQAPLMRLVLISPGLTFPDGDYVYTAGSPRYAWTAAAIDGARAAGIPWVVVGMHKPCLSVGQYACESGADLQQLLLSKRVDLVLSGHEHLYQRTKQLALAPGCAAVTPATFDADCVVSGASTLTKGAGTVFATVGTGGITQRAVSTTDPEAPYFAAASGLATATWGVLDLRATATTLAARFERASGGTFADAFSIGPTAPGTPPFAADTFSRTTAIGFGAAETGGAWRTTGAAADFSVSAGAGRIRLPAPGAGRDVALAVASASTDLALTVAADRVATGSGLHVAVGARRVAGVGEYRAKVQLTATGTVALGLARVTGKTTETVLRATAAVPGLTYAAGTLLRVRVQAVGRAPTTLRARVWRASEPEPTTWTASVIDATAALQVSGTPGVNAYLSSAARNAPVRLLIDDVVARTP